MARTYNNCLSSKELLLPVKIHTILLILLSRLSFSPAPWAFFFLFILFFVSSLLQFDDIVCNTGVSMLMY